jgi:hypothetical protein
MCRVSAKDFLFVILHETFSNSDFANAQTELDVFSQSMNFTRSRFTRHFLYEFSVTGWTVWTPFVILGWFSTQSLMSLDTLTF